MNESIENFLTTCNILNKKIDVVSSFKSRKYEINRISNIVFLAVLIIPTVLLNAVAVITIWKTSQLRRKPCYFVILLQSSVDLGVGCVALPIFIAALLAPFTTNIDVCTVLIVSKSATVFPVGLSIVTLSALTVERYIGVLHPYSYKTLVTKRRIVMFVLGGVLVPSSVNAASMLTEYFFIKYIVTGLLAVFLIFTIFARIRIYLVLRRLARSEARPHEDGGEENEKRRRVLREMKHAMSCFIVVISSLILLAPYTLMPIFTQMGKMNFNAYLAWSGSLILLMCTVNSVIFFWGNTVLRQEAIKILKNSSVQLARS